MIRANRHSSQCPLTTGPSQSGTATRPRTSCQPDLAWDSTIVPMVARNMHETGRCQRRESMRDESASQTGVACSSHASGAIRKPRSVKVSAAARSMNERSWTTASRTIPPTASRTERRAIATEYGRAVVLGECIAARKWPRSFATVHNKATQSADRHRKSRARFGHVRRYMRGLDGQLPLKRGSRVFDMPRGISIGRVVRTPGCLVRIWSAR